MVSAYPELRLNQFRLKFLSDQNFSVAIHRPSTNGAGQILTEYLKEVGEIVIAFDRDRAGKVMADRIMAQLPQAVEKRPKAID